VPGPSSPSSRPSSPERPAPRGRLRRSPLASGSPRCLPRRSPPPRTGVAWHGSRTARPAEGRRRVLPAAPSSRRRRREVRWSRSPMAWPPQPAPSPGSATDRSSRWHVGIRPLAQETWWCGEPGRRPGTSRGAPRPSRGARPERSPSRRTARAMSRRPPRSPPCSRAEPVPSSWPSHPGRDGRWPRASAAREALRSSCSGAGARESPSWWPATSGPSPSPPTGPGLPWSRASFPGPRATSWSSR